MGRCAAILSITTLAALAAPPAAAQRPVRISVGPQGQQADKQSWYNSISYDGRFAGFHSEATNLVPGDTNGVEDVFVYDRLTATLRRVSVDSAGNQGNDTSQRVWISGDGHFAAFHSRASNLVPADTNGQYDIFLHELATGQTTQVSVGLLGQEANGVSWYPTINYDGRYVAFYSIADNLVPNDTNRTWDVFVYDALLGQTARVTVDSAGIEANGYSEFPCISADGRYVGFTSMASNLVPDDTNNIQDVFVHDRDTGQTVRASVSSAGEQANGSCFYPTITADGQQIVFVSNASNLVPGDTNNVGDVFLRDLSTGQTSCLSVSSTGQQGNGSSGWPRISPDGRFVAFNSYASNLVPGDTNGSADIFVRDLQTHRIARITRTWTGQQPNHDSLVPAISSRGHFVVFYSLASNLVPGDTNNARDEFLCDRRGDLDVDGDVDLDDLTLWIAAMAGPGAPAGNSDADLDGDDDVDLADLAILAGNVTGPY